MSDNGMDPYRGLLGVMRDQAAGQIQSTFVVGKVLSATATSIRVQADGHELDEKDILINPELIAGHTVMFPAQAAMTGRLNGAASPCPYGGHSYFDVTDFQGSIQIIRPLEAGDLVLLMPDGSRQLYYLICKVVRYGTVSAD